MKKTLLLLAFSIFISCSSENTNEEEVNKPTNGSKLVKREYVSDNNNVEYRYTEKSLLSQVMHIFLEEDINAVSIFTYDSKGNLTQEYYESRSTNFESTTTYSYDNNDRLTKVVSVSSSGYSNTTTQLFTYSDNIITVNIDRGGYSDLIILETNSSGLVTKLIEENNSTILSYDSEGNIESIQTFDNENDLLHTRKYTYDNKPNPFYGQLESIYIPIFLSAFEDAFYGEIVFDGMYGYDFPFLKNNITSVKPNEHFEKNYSYSYNSNGYPITVTEKVYGNNELVYDIEYY